MFETRFHFYSLLEAPAVSSKTLVFVSNRVVGSFLIFEFGCLISGGCSIRFLLESIPHIFAFGDLIDVTLYLSRHHKYTIAICEKDKKVFWREWPDLLCPSNSDERALSKLEKQLQMIIGPVDVVHFPKRGKINLETLDQDDGGFGQVDGLRFDSEHELLFITTTGLLNAYLQQHKELPTELGKLAKAEEFYSLVFYWNEAVTHFAEVPVRTTNDKSFAYAFLGF